MLLSFLRTILAYLVLIAAVRLMGKRQVAQLEASEFVVALLIADLAAIPIQNGSIPLLSGLVPIATVVGLELLLAFWITKSLSFRKFLCGKPVILIDNGKILEENLRRTRISLDELTGHLRQQNILDITTVQFAILETDGNLSVFPYPEYQPAAARDAGILVSPASLPVTIISDGVVSREDLHRMGKNDKWLKKTLERRNARAETTLLLTLDDEGNVTWIQKETPPDGS